MVPLNLCLSLSRFRIVTLLALVLAVPLTMTSAGAQDASLQFLEGLRNRGYYDTALEYLRDLQASTELPSDVRDVLDLQTAITLQQMGSAGRVPEDRERSFSQAEAAYRKFIAEHPDHEQAAFANSRLGELLFERARTLIWQTASPSNADRKAELQSAARQLIDDAEAIYKKAFELYEAENKAFPIYIDKDKEPDQYQRREIADTRFLLAWFNLSKCTYERGQTYDKGTEERRQILIRAAELFEEIHTNRRNTPIGLHSRLMMGKCFQEQDDIGRALGIYNEILGYPSEKPSVAEVKNTALHYRLICLNDPQKESYQLVLQEASEWLQANRSKIATSAGLGILWEKAVAEEKLAEDRTLDPGSREVLLRQAMADAQQVARYPGAFREAANAMSRRLKASLGDKDKEPRDFETAFERARGMIDQIQKLRTEADQAATAEDKQAKLTALDLHLNEVGRLLQLALSLREDATDAKAVAQARYLLSFIYFRQRKNLDAVIMASYCMTHDGVADPDTALNATDVAINAAVQAWNDAPANDREFETTLIRDVCLKVFELYPRSAKATEARIRLGFVYQQLQNPLEAAKWFLEVPKDDPQYPSARINAGQSFWAAYAIQASGDEEADILERRNADELKTARNEARNLLTEGIQLGRAQLAENAAPTDEIVAAEVSLASILNLEGQFPETIQRLTSGGQNSVMQLIEVADGATRPATGIQSQSFAGLAYRLLLRAYVGTQQIDQAIATMALLEKTGGQDITAIYTQLGMELQEELKRLKQANETQRLIEVRTSFEQFLEKVYAQRDPKNYNSLLWIGETYFGLGQGVADDPVAAGVYYQKAATAYNEILSGQLTQEPTTTAIRLRLARCQRQQLQFPEALAIVTQILSANPLALDAQFEAAYVLSDWGANGEPQRLMDAIQGSGKDNPDQNIWGWSTIAKRLHQTINSDTSADFKDRFMEARWQLSNSRRRYADTGADDAQAQLRAALAEITVFVEVFRDIDPTWWAKFDRLYQDLQADLGESPKALQRPVAIVPVEPDPVTPPTTNSDPAAAAANVAAVAADEPGSSWLLPVLGVCLAAGAAAGFYVLVNKPGPRRRTGLPGTLSTAGSTDFSQLNVHRQSDARGGKPPTSKAGAPSKSGAAATSGAAGVAAAAQTGAGARIVRKPPTGPAKGAATGAAGSPPVADKATQNLPDQAKPVATKPVASKSSEAGRAAPPSRTAANSPPQSGSAGSATASEGTPASQRAASAKKPSAAQAPAGQVRNPAGPNAGGAAAAPRPTPQAGQARRPATDPNAAAGTAKVADAQKSANPSSGPKRSDAGGKRGTSQPAPVQKPPARPAPSSETPPSAPRAPRPRPNPGQAGVGSDESSSPPKKPRSSPPE